MVRNLWRYFTALEEFSKRFSEQVYALRLSETLFVSRHTLIQLFTQVR